MLSNRIKFLFFATIFLVLTGCIKKNEYVFQESTIGSLIKGNFEGNLTIKDLKEHGDFGLGTFNNINGEMIVLEGEVYQADYNGKTTIPKDELKTPFAVVNFFETDKYLEINKGIDCNQLKKSIFDLLPSKNFIYAIKIIGEFENVKFRSVLKQKKPYPSLEEVVEYQNIFELENVSGTAVGYWFPANMKEINIPGFHIHFITKNRKRGGHLLDCKAKNANVILDVNTKLNLSLFQNREEVKNEQ